MLAYDPLKRITAEDALNHPYFQEHPRPGPNAFVCKGKRIASYPRRHKQTAFLATAPGAVGSSAPTAAAPGGSDAATDLQQQHAETLAPVVQQQRGSQQRQQQQRSGPGQQRGVGSQQQQQGSVGKKRKQEVQGRKADGFRAGGPGKYSSK